MAKEINLSSREWCDLVFEGKNKDFGAYVIRTESTERHNKAVLWTLIGTIIFGLLTFGLVKANQYLEQRKLADQVGQEAIIVDMTPQAEEVREKEVIEPEQIEEKPEEQLMTYRATELQIVEDEMVKPEDKILSQEEQVQSDGFAGSVNNSVGSTDLDNIHEHIVDVVVEVKKPVVDKPEEVFTSVEQMPQFPGGDEALMKFLSSHINYPPMAAENNVQGKVILQFVVGKDGRVGEVKIARSVDKDLDKEAMRVVKSLPKFIPGRQNGQAVPVWYTLPVSFKLQGTN
jgi:protein TonB